MFCPVVGKDPLDVLLLGAEDEIGQKDGDAQHALQQVAHQVTGNNFLQQAAQKGWQQDERLMLVIEDDGSGLPPGSGQQGFGLTGMRERVTALGGTLHISCLHGTRVSVSLPQRYV